MDNNYHDLYQMIQQSSKAKEYYESLPQYVQEAMAPRADSINSFDSLRDYAENLTRGDC